jgi:hypothetical protein
MEIGDVPTHLFVEAATVLAWIVVLAAIVVVAARVAAYFVAREWFGAKKRYFEDSMERISDMEDADGTSTETTVKDGAHRAAEPGTGGQPSQRKATV